MVKTPDDLVMLKEAQASLKVLLAKADERGLTLAAVHLCTALAAIEEEIEARD